MGFRGFPADAVLFYEQLEADNSRAFWSEHKHVYEQSVLAPMKALLAELASEFGELHIFRPYRDVRFSRDKAPYKTNIAAAGETAPGASIYVSLSADGLYAGSGYYRMAKDQLERFRAAVDHEPTGSELSAAIAAVAKAGYTVQGDALKTAPRGYPRDHPRVELLRHKGMYAGRMYAPANWLHTKAAIDRVRAAWQAVKPVTGWLDEHVGPSTLAPDDAWR